MVIETLREVADIPDDWDLILIGDGSGSKRGNPGGWGVFPLERSRDGIIMHDPYWGSVSHGSINWMEAMPYWHYLRYHQQALAERKAGCVKTNVHILTDSHYVTQAMAGRSRMKTNRDMRMLFASLEDDGYQIHWHHVRREVVELQAWADRLSAQAREYTQAVEPPPEFRRLYPTTSASDTTP